MITKLMTKVAVVFVNYVGVPLVDRAVRGWTRWLEKHPEVIEEALRDAFCVEPTPDSDSNPWDPEIRPFWTHGMQGYEEEAE